MVGAKLKRAGEVRSALGLFFEQARVPVIVVEPAGALVSANAAALSQYGWTLAELVEMTIEDLMALPRPELPADLDHALRGDAVPLGRRAHRRKDGSVLWVVPRAGPMSILGETLIVSALQDVSAVVHAEQQAHEEQGRVAVVWDAVEHFGRSFALLDTSMRIVKSSRTLDAWLGMKDGEIVGRSCSEVFSERCARAPCPHAVAMAEGRRVVDEFVASSGRPVRLEVWPAPMNDAGIGAIHVAHDISEERALHNRLAASDRLANLGRIAASVAHEVNNPAAFVTLALPLVRDRITQSRLPEALALLDETSAAMGQISEIMHELGDVARDPPRAVVDVAQIVGGALRIASIEAQARARVVRLFEDGVIAEVRGARLAQVVLNLVLNAAQAIPPGSPDRHRIEVSVRSREGRALLQIADTGSGIADDVAERIFQPFFTTRACAGGTGLGLWLSRSIVEEEGGTLSWRNRPEGGAVFTVDLPLGHTAAATSRVESSAAG